MRQIALDRLLSCAKVLIYDSLKSYNIIKELIMMHDYLTTEELSQRIKYDPRTIRERLKDSVLIEGIHYFRPFGGRKILYIWETIEKDMLNQSKAHELLIPMAGGGVCHV